ncbi:MAG: putative metallopeptidase [Nitrospirota bacterium]|nr:putative metallopeptidase [Nitrospirota bacterium]
MKCPPFDYTRHVADLMEDIVRRCPELSHIDMSHVSVAFTTSRSGGRGGAYAQIAPLRFEGGVREVAKGMRRYRMQTFIHRDKELLYVIYLASPRFIDLPFFQKLTTIVHELYHISPDFNGDLRRFNSRNYAHGSSRKRYNEKMEALANGYLASNPPEGLMEFLHLNMKGLQEKFGEVTGRRVQQPRAVRVA